MINSGARLGLAVTFAFGAAAAGAQETTTLKLATYMAPSHYIVTEGVQKFMDDSAARLDGALTWDFYPAEQLGKASEMLPLLLSGAVDAVAMVPSYNADKLPLSSIFELPGLANSSCDATRAVRAIGDPGGVMYEEDFGPAGVRVLTNAILPPYIIYTNKTLDSIDDFQGLKMRPSGGGMELSVAALGGTGVKMQAPEMYDGLSRGIVDAVMTSYSSGKSYDLQKAAKAGILDGYSTGAGAVYILITEKKLAELPEEVRETLLASGQVAEDAICAYMDAKEDEVRKEYEDAGVTITDITPELKAALDERLAGVADAWVERMSKQGRSAERALADFRAAVPAN